MISERGYTAGWFDSSIHDFLDDLPRPFASIQVALITCLDSQSDLRRLFETSDHLRALAVEAEFLGEGLLVPTRRLLEVDRDGRIFFGFDEVWFFPQSPREPKPASACLVGPQRIGQESLRRVAPWMERNSCSLGLGDGTGLNVTAKVHGLARHLVAHSVAQSDPS